MLGLELGHFGVLGVFALVLGQHQLSLGIADLQRAMGGIGDGLMQAGGIERLGVTGKKQIVLIRKHRQIIRCNDQVRFIQYRRFHSLPLVLSLLC
ncbi:MAG: hypothetical protein D9N14_14045 [Ketobacter sp.]|nr:MAG: hypothetical protein D9N14_14045 [Ketobacter sp.]